VEELLNKLPKQVIKNGNIINVRDNIGKEYFGVVEKDSKDPKEKEVRQGDIIMSKVHRQIVNGKVDAD